MSTQIAANYPSLSGRVAIVTGGGKGLGRAFVRQLAMQGALLVIAQRSQASADSLCRDLAAQGLKALAIATDVADPQSVSRMVERSLDTFGRIDILVNNAAMVSQLKTGPFWEISPDEWRSVLEVNLTGAFLCARAVTAAMQARRWGRIINISSTSIVSGRPTYLHYTASKAAMIGMTRSMARALGQWNITVNTLLPGTTRTESARPASDDAYFEMARQQQSIQRLAQVEDHANALLFLCSDDAGFISGQSMMSDGGRSFI